MHLRTQGFCCWIQRKDRALLATQRWNNNSANREKPLETTHLTRASYLLMWSGTLFLPLGLSVPSLRTWVQDGEVAPSR